MKYNCRIQTKVTYKHQDILIIQRYIQHTSVITNRLQIEEDVLNNKEDYGCHTIKGDMCVKGHLSP